MRLSVVLLRDEPEAEQEGRVERLLDALHALLDGRDLLALPQRDDRHVLGLDVLDLAERLLADRGVVRCELLVQEVVDLLVLVAVGVEATVTHERGQVVVGVREVREPTETVEVVRPLRERLLLVLVPLRRIEVDLEQVRRLELTLDLVPHVGFRGAVAARRVPRVELDRRLDARLVEERLGLGRVGRAVRLLEGLLAPREGRRNGRVQRRHAALVHRLRDRLAVDALGDGLTNRLVLDGVLAHVEDDVADLRAGAVDDLDALVGLVAQVLEVGRGQRAVGHVDLAALDRQLQRRRLVEVLDDEVRRLRLVRAVVLRVDREDGLLVRGVLVQLVRAGADDLVLGLDLVGRVGLVRDDRADVVREDEREGRVDLVQLHRDRRRVSDLDRVERAEQRVGAGRVLDLEHAVQRELDVLGRQRVTAGELQVRLELADVRLRIRELAALRRVGLGLVLPRRNRQEGLVDVADHLLATQVVTGCRVQGRHLVGGAEDHRVGVTRRGLGRRARGSGVATVIRTVTARCGANRKQSCTAEYGQTICAHVLRPPPMGTGSLLRPFLNLEDGRPAARRANVETAMRQRKPTSQPALVRVGSSQRRVCAHQPCELEPGVQCETVGTALERAVRDGLDALQPVVQRRPVQEQRFCGQLGVTAVVQVGLERLHE